MLLLALAISPQTKMNSAGFDPVSYIPNRVLNETPFNSRYLIPRAPASGLPSTYVERRAKTSRCISLWLCKSIMDGSDWRTAVRMPLKASFAQRRSAKNTRSANNRATATSGRGIRIRMTSSLAGKGGGEGFRTRLRNVQWHLNRNSRGAILRVVTSLVSRKAFAMAAEDHIANPIIVEPAASSNPETSPGLLNPSPNTSSSSSSSNSFESSRPKSRGSSATTPSESSSPAMKDVQPYEVTNLRPSTPLDFDPLPATSTVLPNERPRTLSTTVVSERVQSSFDSNGALYRPTIARRRWLEHALGVFTLAASLVGLLFIGVRTYKLAVISTENSTLDACTDLIQVSQLNIPSRLFLIGGQAGFTTVENSSPLCKTVMQKGPLSSPYHLDKRTLHSGLALASKWVKGLPKQTCRFPYIGCQSPESNTIYRNIRTPAIIISTTIALACLIFKVTHRNARLNEVFANPVRSDIHIPRHSDSGPEVVAGQGIIEEHKPEDHDDLGQLRKRIRASQTQDSLMEGTAPFQSTNGSSTAPVNKYKKPKVSLENRSSGEKHKGLIELQMNGSTKAFFKPETGEFLHLNHWKHQHSDDSGLFPDGGNPLNSEGESCAQTGLGTSALAKGKAVKDRCLAGLVVNELPTGKPQTI